MTTTTKAASEFDWANPPKLDDIQSMFRLDELPLHTSDRSVLYRGFLKADTFRFTNGFPDTKPVALKFFWKDSHYHTRKVHYQHEINMYSRLFPDFVGNEIEMLSKVKHETKTAYAHRRLMRPFAVYECSELSTWWTQSDFKSGCDAGAYVVVMPFASNGSLFAALKSARVSVPMTSLTRDMIAAVKECHEKGVVHCDLKPENFVLMDDGRLVLCDFDLARRLTMDRLVEQKKAKLQQQVTDRKDPVVVPSELELDMEAREYFQGILTKGTDSKLRTELLMSHPPIATVMYRPPEVMLGDVRATFAVDIWALGCILAEFYRVGHHRVMMIKQDHAQTYWTRWRRVFGPLTDAQMPGLSSYPLAESADFRSAMDSVVDATVAGGPFGLDNRELFPSLQTQTVKPVKDLLSHMLSCDPNTRPSIQMIALDIEKIMG